MQQLLADNVQLYRAELAEIKKHLARPGINWWVVYPMMVRLNELARIISITLPFDKQQMKHAKEKLCQSRSSPPSLTLLS